MSINPPFNTLKTPEVDLAKLTDRLGQAWAVSGGESIPQYLAWCETAGIFSLFESGETLTIDEIVLLTPLSARGADALVSILLALDLVRKKTNGVLVLSELAQEYLINGKPFFVGDGLYSTSRTTLPGRYLKEPGDVESYPWTMQLKLKIQHSRNFAPGVVAVRTGLFDGITHLVDIGGGSGVISIPIALDYPHIRVTLVDVPSAIDIIRESLATYGVDQRIKLIGMDVLHSKWNFGPCDGIVFGNFFHSCDDQTCLALARKSFDALSENGRVWLHEVLFNSSRDGPLLAALWNANMISRSMGRQRTSDELFEMLHAVGFRHCYCEPTAGHFSLVGAMKPE